MTSSDQLKTYEIHFLYYGVKKQVTQRAPFMSEANAWWIAAVESGIPVATLPSFSILSLLIDAAENQGISGVRWNLATESG